MKEKVKKMKKSFGENEKRIMKITCLHSNKTGKSVNIDRANYT